MHSIHRQSINADQASQLAAQFKGVQQKHWASALGISPKAASVFGWTTWPNLLNSGSGFVLSLDESPAVIMWLEPDIFNSICLHAPQARLHWLLNPNVVWSIDKVTAFSIELAAVLKTLEWELVALRLLGHDPSASELFQRAGFRMIIGNVWFYRWPRELPVSVLPHNIEVEWRTLKQYPFLGHDLDELLAVAMESFFPDRFSLDSRIDPKHAKSRFLAVIENALTGKIADYAITARVDSETKALIFFGVTQSGQAENSYFIAGKWLTALSRRSLRLQGLGSALVAEAIRHLPEGKVNWTAACALDNFASLSLANKFGFQIGAIAYDFHWWRDELSLQR